MSQKKIIDIEELEKVNGGSTAYYRECPSCGALTAQFLYRCSGCGGDLSNVASKEYKVCPACHRPNKMTRTLCLYCLETL